MKTPQQRREQRREERLEEIRQQIDAGTLRVRQMTVKERAMFPRRPDVGKKKRRWQF